MTEYRGEVQRYSLSMRSPNAPTRYKSVIHLQGTFGEAFFYFTPPEETLYSNRKRAGTNVFDVYCWMYSWPHFVDVLRNEGPVNFRYDDVTNVGMIETPYEPVGEAEGP